MLKIKVLQRGIGLLELMLSLAIIAVLIVVAARYFESTKNAQEVIAAHTQILEIVQAANRYRAIHGSYVGANLNNLKPFLSASMADNVTGKDSDAAAPAPFNGTFFKLTEVSAAYIRISITGFDKNNKCQFVAEGIAGAVCSNNNSIDFYYPKKP